MCNKKMEKLFVYGTLGPNQPNEGVLKKIGGDWENGFVKGKLYNEGWGANLGCPGIRLEKNGEEIKGHIFISNRLREYWKQLDDFEGKAYQRVKTKIILENTRTEIEAFIYVLK